MKYIIGYFRKCDLITMLGTSLGFLGITFSFKSQYSLAIICLILCGICDAFDGTIARKYKYSNEAKEYGVQLDSLSDVICFGIFPAVLTVSLNNSTISIIICIIYMLCGVIRLAYFNMLHTTNTGKKGIYIGIPITVIAGIYPLSYIIFKTINFSLLKLIMPYILLITGLLFISKIEIKKPDVVKITKKIFNKYTVNYILFPMTLILCADLFYRLNILSIFNALRSSITLIFKYFLPFLILYLFIVSIYQIILSITKKNKITIIILTIISLILFIINDIKFNIMGIPIEISDIYYLNSDGVNMMVTATNTIGSWIFATIIKSIIFLTICYLFLKYNKINPLEDYSIKKRIIYLVVSILLFIILSNVITNNSSIITKNIYKTSKEDINKFNSVTDISNEYGLIQGIILSNINKKSFKPQNYSLKLTNEILSNYSNKTTTTTWGKANVVFILSESFSDIENIDEITFNKPLTSNINSYRQDKDKMVTNLVVPSYGGTSVNTEFEILTGASLSFWSPGIIPYTQYYNTPKSTEAPNIIKEFNKNGYETIYLTPWQEHSYNSSKVYNKYFNVTKTIYGSKLTGDKKGYYYSDESLMNDIYNELSTTSTNNYKFIMTATAQNHFPYNGKKYSNYDIDITNSRLKKEDNLILKNYAEGIYDADKELNNLYQKIQNLSTPTIIVFFGDHLPYAVDGKGYDAYINSSYFNTPDAYLNTLRKYTTKAVVLANYDINCDDLEYLNASFLGAYILNKLDLNISNYYKYLDTLREDIPAFTRQGIYENNKVIPYENINSSKLNLINSYKNIQYSLFHDKNSKP